MLRRVSFVAAGVVIVVVAMVAFLAAALGVATVAPW